MLASRARDTTEWVFALSKVEKLAEMVPPTEKMVGFAQAVEDKRLAMGEAPALNSDVLGSFAATRDFLDRHAYQITDGVKEPLTGKLAELKDVLQAMSKSQQKESTLDYQSQPGKDKAAELGGMDME